VRHHEGYHHDYPQYAADQLSYQTGNQPSKSAGSDPAGDAGRVHAGDEAERQRYQKYQAAQE
jgi:hypothetical protein